MFGPHLVIIIEIPQVQGPVSVNDVGCHLVGKVKELPEVDQSTTVDEDDGFDLRQKKIKKKERKNKKRRVKRVLRGQAGKETHLFVLVNELLVRLCQVIVAKNGNKFEGEKIWNQQGLPRGKGIHRSSQKNVGNYEQKRGEEKTRREEADPKDFAGTNRVNVRRSEDEDGTIMVQGISLDLVIAVCKVVVGDEHGKGEGGGEIEEIAKESRKGK
jgi:hypothetical protein